MKFQPEFLLLTVLVQYVAAGAGPKVPDTSAAAGRRLPPCQSCRTLVTSFLLGMEKTAKGHYGGGDTAWEEENGKIYKDSELRLIEIQEKLCAEVSTGKDQCHELAVENEDALEEWWNKYRNAGQDLFTWFCISKLAVCCPEHHFGSQCLPCTGFPDNICSGHGKCKGDGTRKGNGECNCDAGYTGKLCDTCSTDYYEAFKDDGMLICSPCHKSCKNGCTAAGAKNCKSCKEGWESDEDIGCLDINECLMLDSPCKFSEFCVNTEGSHRCIPCDKSCDGCDGDGPDMCEKCAKGYILKDKLCVDGSASGRSMKGDYTRYFTYLGLCIATCIIFQKNMVIAAIIGLAVTIYITVSEYLLSSSSGI